jgi:subtilisin-like proprotein convertase family protein
MQKTIKSLLYIFTSVFLTFVPEIKAQMYWNQAATFAGNSTSYITIPNSASLDITGSFSLEAWVNPASTSNKGVISKGGTLLKYGIRITGSRVVFITNGAVRLSSKTTSLIPVNTWTHISATFNSSTNSCNIYINGIPDTSAVVAATPTSNTDSLFIGNSGTTTPFNGKLDEVRVWNRELTATEVNNYMRTSLETSSGIYSGLILSMTFQNPVHTSPFSFNDQSGNSNNGFGRNVTQFDQSHRPLHTISQNECVMFSGNNSYIAGKDMPALTPASSITLECWFYPTVAQPMTILKKGNSYEIFYTGSRVNVKVNGVNITTSGTGLLAPLNQWSYFVFSYNSDEGKYFINVNGSVIAAFTGVLNVPVNTDSLLIGGGIGESDFVGYIDEIRISNRAVNKEKFKDYMNASIDSGNDPSPSSVSPAYSFDGNLSDNANEGGPKLYFRNDAHFSHPGQIAGQPVSPLNRNSNESFENGFYMRTPFLIIPAIGSISDQVRINSHEAITDVNLFIATNHQFLSDLEIYLIAPNGDSVRVFNAVNSNSSDNNLITIFDDNADSSLINAGYNSFYTKIKPANNMNSAFVGDNPCGNWKLRVNDNEGGNSGILYAWGIQVNGMQKREINLNLSCLLQGFYDPASNLMIPDTITLNVRKKFSPYDIVETDREVLDSIGMARFSLSQSNVNNDSSFVLQILHRNTIESWSNGFISFTNYESNPNLSLFNVSVFGSNSIQVDFSPIRFALYSGDVNQDGTIDASDLSNVENDAADALSGYISTDLTGDDFVDGTDVSIVDNNITLGINVISP